jgi:cytochrome c oxidase cbb3-type subunit 3
MKSWKDDYSPKQLQEIASFVKSLKGTKSATPKEAQGEIYIEAGVVTAVADSSVAKEKK